MRRVLVTDRRADALELGLRGTGRRWRRMSLRALIGVVAVTLVAAAPADAATVSVSSGKLLYAGGAGPDAVDVGLDSGTWTVSRWDSTYPALSAGSGCSGGPDAVTCPAASVTGGLRFELGDGINALSYAVDASQVPKVPAGTAVQVVGGSGVDYIADSPGAEAVSVGAGDDTVETGRGSDTIDTGAGDDVVYDYESGGTSTVSLGRGQDLVGVVGADDGSDHYDGGAGLDRIDYSARAQPVTVDLSGAAAVTPDDVTTDFENADGSHSAANTLIGDAAPNLLNGGGAADTIDGGSGDDQLGGRSNSTGDVLRGGPGFDVVLAGNGNDTIDFRDGMEDTLVYCFFGTDEVLLDQYDAGIRLDDCETSPVASVPAPAALTVRTIEGGFYDGVRSAPYLWDNHPYMALVNTPLDDGGLVTIATANAPTLTPPGDVSFQGEEWTISAAQTGAPLRLDFYAIADVVPKGSPGIYRDGAAVPACTGATALPAGVGACVTQIVLPEYGGGSVGYTPLLVQVLATPNEHTWNLGFGPAPPDDGGGGGGGGGGSGGGGVVIPPSPQPPVGVTPPPTGSGTGPGTAAAVLGRVRSTVGRRGGRVTAAVTIRYAGSALTAALRYRGRVLGAATRRNLAAGPANFTIRLNRRARKLLARRRVLKARLRVHVRPPGRAGVVLQRSVKLRRR